MNPVVIDTNCLLQIISRRSPYRPIWDAFLAGRYTLCASNEILDEYQEILEQQISPTVAENVVMLILNQENVQLVDPHFRMGIITADPDDNKFVDCAFAAGADYLVSEDSVGGQPLPGAPRHAFSTVESRHARRVPCNETRSGTVVPEIF